MFYKMLSPTHQGSDFNVGTVLKQFPCLDICFKEDIETQRPCVGPRGAHLFCGGQLQFFLRCASASRSGKQIFSFKNKSGPGRMAETPRAGTGDLQISS
jgi:hypothetical protein